ncbi:hypothetical protein [Nocardiopsis ansamitocini]|uniref:Small multidrug efflux protein n=1 Tax=Nocardiopsis ansamitocini TaxID=1670832 RepID=A0A9W6PAA4_9ACTN|nr:hypothetical protein [Nocardiopsis ansamitocini]GLU50006.1 hypothetical protein Nans01_43570 [Nocardiopsis ansamitocini]
MFEQLQSFTESLSPALQWIAVILLGVIPFVESYLGSVIGVVAGLSPFVAIPAAILGNLVSMLVAVYAAHSLRSRVRGDRPQAELSPRRAKLKARFDRYGVAGVSLLGPLVLASQITSAATISFGASRNSVIFWQSVAIVLWGVGFGGLAALGVDLAG